MRTNQFFDVRRFGMMCRRELLEPWKTHLLRFVACYAVLAVILVGYGMETYNHLSPGTPLEYSHALMQFFMVIFYVMGMLFASSFMERMKTKTGRIAFLITPASAFEKYLSRWLLVTVVFIVAFAIAFWLADLTKVLVCRMLYSNVAEQITFVPWSEVFTHPYAVWRLGVVASSFCFLQSLFVLGSVIWPKNAWIKTCAALIVILLLHVQAVMVVYQVRGSFHRGFYLTDEDMNRLVIGVGIVWAVFNWTLAYFRFKESEIINRW